MYAGVYGRVIAVYGPDNPSEYFGPYRVDIQVGDYRVIYGHLDGNILVEVNDYATPATIIAGVGNPSGDRNQGNDHLHLEVRTPVREQYRISNPLLYMSEYDISRLATIVEPNDNFLAPQVDLVNGLGILEQPDIVRGGTSLWR